jgi:glucosamine-6-phosphate deaminase
MEVVIHPAAASAAHYAARKVANLVRRKPDAVLGLATGSTPLGLYAELIRMHREAHLDFRHVRTFNLDEYLGLGSTHPASYRTAMQEMLFHGINVTPEHIHIPPGLVDGHEVEAACEAYEEAIIECGGIDMQILGIGSDGHIGFNEPSSSLTSRTRIKTLTERTRSDNARFFHSIEEVPHHVITMGIGTIMEARELLLMAFGSAKATAVAGAIEGPLSAANPASIIQMHPKATILLDDDAAAGLARADYYKWVFTHKPPWQQI